MYAAMTFSAYASVRKSSEGITSGQCSWIAFSAAPALPVRYHSAHPKCIAPPKDRDGLRRRGTTCLLMRKSYFAGQMNCSKAKLSTFTCEPFHRIYTYACLCSTLSSELCALSCTVPRACACSFDLSCLTEFVVRRSSSLYTERFPRVLVVDALQHSASLGRVLSHFLEEFLGIVALNHRQYRVDEVL